MYQPILGKQPIKQVKNLNFSGGINTVTPEFYMQENEMLKAMNISYDKYPAICSAKADFVNAKNPKLIDVTVNEPGLGQGELVGSFEWKGQMYLIMFFNNGTMKVYNAYFDDEATITTDDDIRRVSAICKFGDKIIIAGKGYGPLSIYMAENPMDSDSWIKVENSKLPIDINSKLNYTTKIFLISDENRLYLSTDKDNKIFISKVGEVDFKLEGDVNNSGDELLLYNDNEKISGITYYKNHIIIFKKHSFYELWGKTRGNFKLEQIANDIGCNNAKNIRIVNDMLIWSDGKNVYRYTGGRPKNITSKLSYNKVFNGVAFYDFYNYYLDGYKYDTRYDLWTEYEHGGYGYEDFIGDVSDCFICPDVKGGSELKVYLPFYGRTQYIGCSILEIDYYPTDNDETEYYKEIYIKTKGITLGNISDNETYYDLYINAYIPPKTKLYVKIYTPDLLMNDVSHSELLECEQVDFTNHEPEWVIDKKTTILKFKIPQTFSRIKKFYINIKSAANGTEDDEMHRAFKITKGKVEIYNIELHACIEPVSYLQ